jgi:hypothetical protein
MTGPWPNRPRLLVRTASGSSIRPPPLVRSPINMFLRLS